MVPHPSRRSLRLFLHCVLILGVMVVTSERVPTQSPSYGVFDLGTLGGASAEGHDLGELAQAVVGRAQTAAGTYHAFAFGPTGRKDLGTLGGAESIAFASFGSDVVGQAQTASGQRHAFLASTLTAAPMRDLGTLGGSWSAAYDIGSSFVVGASLTSGNARLQAASSTRGGTMTALPVNWGGDSVADAVNFNDDVAGYACTPGNAVCHAFLLSGGTVTDLGSIGGNSAAHDLNSSGQVVGTSYLANKTTTRAFLYQNGAMIDLGTLGGVNSEALAINEAGDIVGSAQNAAGAARAFLWHDGAMTDLNALLPSGSGWVLTSAAGISDGGQIVGTGTHYGATRAFILTPPTDVEVRPNGVRSLADSNLPRGVEAGKSIQFVLSVDVPAGAPRMVYGVRLTDTLYGPAEYVSARIFNDAGRCQVTPKVVTCDLFPIDGIVLGQEVALTIKTTAAGQISHIAAISGISDPNPANDSTSEQNYAVSLSTLTLTPATVAGGKAVAALLTLTSIAPRSDAVTRVTSSRPDIAAVRDPFVVPSWTDHRGFNIIPAAVSEPTEVVITATYGFVTRTATLTVVPAALSYLYLTPTTVIGGCGTSAGKILLSGVAPPGGAVVPMTATNPNAIVPASVTVDPGATSKTFTVTTKTVTALTTGTVTASYGGISKSLMFTVRPIRVRTLTLSPNPVAGGATVSGRIELECPAAPGSVVVTLSSSKPSAAAPTVSQFVMPAGATTASFSVRTSAVTVNTPVTIYATVFGTRKAGTVTVTPGGP